MNYTQKNKQTNTGRTHFKLGSIPWNKGKPGLKGSRNGMFGKTLSQEARKKISDTHRMRDYSLVNYPKGENHWNWKGDDVGYNALHSWIQREFGSANRCSQCGKNKKLYHWANKSGKYLRDISDWRQLCVSCHSIYDRSRR